MRCKAGSHGSWYRVRQTHTKDEMWFGVAYVRPHYPAIGLQEALHDFLQLLPATSMPCVITGDTNAPLSWLQHEGQSCATGDDGKGRVFVDMVTSQGFDSIAPGEDQRGSTDAGDFET